MKRLEDKWKEQKKFAQKLFKEFPELFRHKDNQMESLMSFGVETSKGWHDIIYNLTRMVSEYSKAKKLDIEVVQVKEKFGGLRYYIHGGDEYIYNLISKAEDETFKICEKCGKPGKLRTKGWYYTLCNKCQKERETNKDWGV